MRLRLRTVKAGENFGRTLQFTNEGPATLVEFYEAEGDETPFGRLLCRYFAKTIVEATPDASPRVWLRPRQEPAPLSPGVFTQVRDWVESMCPEPEALFA